MWIIWLHFVGAGSGVAACARPIGVEKLAARFVGALVGVRAEVIALGLQQIGRQARGSVAVQEGNRRRHARHGNADFNRFGNGFAPCGQGVEQDFLEIRVCAQEG